jgi:hypothetical protein
MNTISNVHTCLYILNECHNTIERLYFEFDKYSRIGIPYDKNTFQHEIGKYIILNAASFIDEYEIYFTQTKKSNKRPKPIEPECVQRIKDLDEIIKPILITINRWGGIKKYRDNFVAHMNRSGWNHKTLIIAFQERYDAPRQFWEFQLLRDLIHIMFGVISQEFKTELTEAYFCANTLKPTINPLKDNSNIQAELENMVNGFNNISRQQGKEYSLNIPEISYEPLKILVDPFPSFSHPITLFN